MLLIAALLLGCAPDIAEGDYRFETHAVDDTCLDGALEALFMPAGRDTPHAFAYPIPVPALADLPQSYDISLREPFVGMPVTVQETEAGIAIRGAVMESVLLDEASYGDCVATMRVDADMRSDGDGALVGEARIDLRELRGDDGRCPGLEADPCRVRLDLRAERIAP